MPTITTAKQILRGCLLILLLAPWRLLQTMWLLGKVYLWIQQRRMNHRLSRSDYKERLLLQATTLVTLVMIMILLAHLQPK